MDHHRLGSFSGDASEHGLSLRLPLHSQSTQANQIIPSGSLPPSVVANYPIALPSHTNRSDFQSALQNQRSHTLHENTLDTDKDFFPNSRYPRVAPQARRIFKRHPAPVPLPNQAWCAPSGAFSVPKGKAASAVHGEEFKGLGPVAARRPLLGPSPHAFIPGPSRTLSHNQISIGPSGIVHSRPLTSASLSFPALSAEQQASSFRPSVDSLHKHRSGLQRREKHHHRHHPTYPYSHKHPNMALLDLLKQKYKMHARPAAGDAFAQPGTVRKGQFLSISL